MGKLVCFGIFCGFELFVFCFFLDRWPPFGQKIPINHSGRDQQFLDAMNGRGFSRSAGKLEQETDKVVAPDGSKIAAGGSIFVNCNINFVQSSVCSGWVLKIVFGVGRSWININNFIVLGKKTIRLIKF